MAIDLSSFGQEGETARGAGDAFWDFVSAGVSVASLFNPWARALQSSPYWQTRETQRIGREHREELEEAMPDLQRMSPELLERAGEQAVGERVQTFEQLQEWQRAQVGEITDFRIRRDNAMTGLQQADSILRQAGLSSNIQLRQGMQDLNRMRQATLGFIGQGMSAMQQRLDEIRAGNQEVLDGIDVDVEGRMSALSDGITARTEATFRQHERMMDSEAHMEPGERRALRMMYEAMASSDIAVAAGTLHENSVEYRGKVATDLQTSENQARSYAASTAAGLMISGVQAFAQAEEISAGLRKNHVNNVRMVNIARTELKQFAATYTETTGQMLWNMVNETVRPVLVFSDILYDAFDGMFDITAYNNNVDMQIYVNQVEAISATSQAQLAALNILPAAAETKRQRDLQERGQTMGLIGDVYQAVATGAGAAAGA
jgi:hypothetical protein